MAMLTSRHSRLGGRRLLQAAIVVLGTALLAPAGFAESDTDAKTKQPPPECPVPEEVLKVADGGKAVSATIGDKVVPDQTKATVTIQQRHPGADHSFRAFIQWPKPEAVAGSGTDAKQDGTWGDALPLAVTSSAKAGQDGTSVLLAIPENPKFTDTPARILIAACKEAESGKAGKSAPTFVAAAEIEVSSRGRAILLAVLVVMAAYGALAATVRHARRDKAPFNEAGFWRSLDPVVVTSGFLGRGSLSKFQILFFTGVVAGLLTYVLTRTEQLSDLSTDVLMLLGIAGAGAAGGKVTALSRNRLHFENWSWMVEKGWITETEGQKGELPAWSDLIMEGGEFNIYKFQMLVFSLIVGIALLTAGLSELASFTIPQTLLGVLGLSQVVYVGGKAVTPPSWGELDTAVTELKKLDLAFTTKAAKALQCLPAAPAAALQESAAKAKTELEAFRAAEAKTRRMVALLFKPKQTPAILDPTVPMLPVCADPPAKAPRRRKSS